MSVTGSLMDVAATNPDIEQLVRPDRLHARIYADATIFRLEMKRLFEQRWVYVGHESEISMPGDYKRSHLGLQPIVVTRDQEGVVRVLVNRCPHRGSLVCREDKGNSNFFRCPYHGWTFKNSGQLAGVPRWNRYSDDFDRERLRLLEVPHVEIYRGFVFASFNTGIEPVTEYLGRARSYLDLMLDLSVDGELVLSAGSNKHEYAGNWKFQMENGVDGYHAMHLHDSFFKLKKRGADRSHARLESRDEDLGWTEAFPNGHALLGRKAGRDTIDNFHRDFPDYAGRLDEKLGTERVRDALAQLNLFIFPNLYVLLNQVRVIQPLSVDRTLVTMYPSMLSGAPAELNERRLREHEEGFAPSGFIAPDDFEAFVCVQEGLQADSVPWFELSRGLHDEQVLEDGSRRGKPSDETTQRGQYREYGRLMSQGESR